MTGQDIKYIKDIKDIVIMFKLKKIWDIGTGQDKKDIKRKVAAIMFTDISGYTKLASEDEEKAFQLIKKTDTIITIPWKIFRETH